MASHGRWVIYTIGGVLVSKQACLMHVHTGRAQLALAFLTAGHACCAPELTLYQMYVVDFARRRMPSYRLVSQSRWHLYLWRSQALPGCHRRPAAPPRLPAAVRSPSACRPRPLFARLQLHTICMGATSLSCIGALTLPDSTESVLRAGGWDALISDEVR